MLTLKDFFSHWDDVHSVTVRLIRQIPPDRLDFKAGKDSIPIRELVTHIYHTENVFAHQGKKGVIVGDEFNDYAIPDCKTVGALVDYADRVHKDTNELYRDAAWEEMNGIVKAHWGDMPLFVLLLTALEHHFHHRGQFYMTLRMLGVENLVFIYEYE